MRSLFATLLLTSALPAWAETVSLNTDVTDALITSQGGLITYTAPVALPVGRHTIVAHLPNYGIQDAVAAVRFQDSTGVRVISTEYANTKAAPIFRKDSEELIAARAAVHEAEVALRAFDEKVETKEAALRAAELKITFLETTAKSNQGGTDTGMTAEQFSALAEMMASTMQASYQERARIKSELAAISVGRDDLEKKAHFAKDVVNSLTPDTQIDLIEVSFEVQVEQAVTTMVEIDNIEPASWSPVYQIELQTEQASGTLSIHRQAQIFVGNGITQPVDEWQDVHIILSTENLRKQTGTHIPQPNIQRLASPGKSEGSFRLSKTYNDSMVNDAPVLEMAAATGTPVAASFSGETLIFDLGSGHSVGWQADRLIKSIDTVTRSVDLYAMANAAQDQYAYLYADMTNDTGGVWLPGAAKLHRDGSLIGETYFPTLLPNQTEPIGLGPMYALRVKRDTLNVQEGDSGFISSRSEIDQNYRTTITSSLEYAIPVKLLDVVPTSEDENLVINLNASPKPTLTDRDGKRGVLVWEFDLDPSASETVEFGYRMKWPTDKIPVQR